MQITALRIQPISHENFHNDSKSLFHHRQIFTIVTSIEKQPKSRRSHLSDSTVKSNDFLPELKTREKQQCSIQIQGHSLNPTKFQNISLTSFNQMRRSTSRLSEKHETPRGRSRSVSPSGSRGRPPKLLRLKFGYPVKPRPPEFYAPSLTESELRLREDSFVNDSIRSAHHGARSSVIPPYEPLEDPNLKEFFHSPLVSDVVRKTLQKDLRDRPVHVKKHLKKDDTEDYHRIIAKHSSGYGKLNGYNCMPWYAPRHPERTRTHDKYHSPSNSSIASYTQSNNNVQTKKQFSRLSNRSKRLTPITTSSPLKNPSETMNNTVPLSNDLQE